MSALECVRVPEYEGLKLESYLKLMNFISLEPSPQQPNLDQTKVYYATNIVLGAFMIVSFLVICFTCRFLF